MKEDLLHFAWRFRHFNQQTLQDTQGNAVLVLETGTYNQHGGPDFLQARIQIGSITWIGHVEMHLRSSDWYKHAHSTDPAYQNVVLHVVLEDDQPVLLPDGSKIPCLELRRHISPSIVRQYLLLQNNKQVIACQNHLHTVPDLTRTAWMERLKVERIETIGQRLEQWLDSTVNDWEQVLYKGLMRTLCGQVNAQAAEWLAECLPIKALSKHRNDLLSLEALLLGQTGLLPKHSENPYVAKLIREFKHLEIKYSLVPQKADAWQFMRLRPANFPTLRLAQMAKLLYQLRSGLFSKLVLADTLQQAQQLLSITMSGYWVNHYHFEENDSDVSVMGSEVSGIGEEEIQLAFFNQKSDTPVRTIRHKTLGSASTDLLLINTVIPLLWVYGKCKGDAQYQEKALDWWEQLAAEDNQITRHWKRWGLESQTAADTQALLHLKKNYCDGKKCTTCSIGNVVLNNTPNVALAMEPALPYGIAL